MQSIVQMMPSAHGFTESPALLRSLAVHCCHFAQEELQLLLLKNALLLGVDFRMGMSYEDSLGRPVMIAAYAFNTRETSAGCRDSS